MRKFNVTVNGNSYEVCVDEIKDGFTAPAIERIPQPVPAEKPKAASAPAPVKAAPAQAVNATGAKLLSPMPGVLLKLSVKSGAAVKKGEVVCVLEAMKMENDIVAPENGIITFLASEGSTVSTGDAIAVIG